jgi:hypothetical protein
MSFRTSNSIRVFLARDILLEQATSALVVVHDSSKQLSQIVATTPSPCDDERKMDILASFAEVR